MGGDKGGSADSSGMYEAMASAQEADKAYQLGEQQLQWTEQVWNQEQPLMDESEQTQIDLAHQQEASLQQMSQEAGQQWNMYEQDYAPLEEKYLGQVSDWASPGNQALVRGQAMSDVGEMGQAGLNTAAETLREYGVNPSSPRYASLYTTAQPMLGAAEAAAGTTASQNLKLQQLGLESGAINTGRGLVNATGALTTAGTGAGAAGASAASGAGTTAMNDLMTGSNANTNSTQFLNAGTNAMNSYVGAVNGYNQSQAQYAEAGAQEMSGFGSALGSVLGLGFMGKFAKGGAVGYDDGGAVGAIPPAPAPYPTDVPSGAAPHAPAGPPIPYQSPMPAYMYPQGSVPGPVVGYPGNVGQTLRVLPKSDPSIVARGPIPQPNAAQRAPQGIRMLDTRDGGRNVTDLRAGGGSIGGNGYQMTPDQGGGQTGIPSAPMPPRQNYAAGGVPGHHLPSDATPGGGVPAHASPSHGAAVDDVDAKLTAGEFVIPKDVAMWKGHEYFAKQLDKARRGQQHFASRSDVGGEPSAEPPGIPRFVSRPGAIPRMATG